MLMYFRPGHGLASALNTNIAQQRNAAHHQSIMENSADVNCQWLYTNGKSGEASPLIFNRNNDNLSVCRAPKAGSTELRGIHNGYFNETCLDPKNVRNSYVPNLSEDCHVITFLLLPLGSIEGESETRSFASFWMQSSLVERRSY